MAMKRKTNAWNHEVDIKAVNFRDSKKDPEFRRAAGHIQNELYKRKKKYGQSYLQPDLLKDIEKHLHKTGFFTK